MGQDTRWQLNNLSKVGMPRCLVSCPTRVRVSAGGSFIANLAGAPAPAFIWGSDWGTGSNPAYLPPIPNGDWNNNQRLKQYQGNVSIPVGGGSAVVDLDEADGPLC
jgi:hypothetical protein